jgi:hypothetical protein
MRDGSDHPQTSFVRHGDFPSPTVNHVRQSLLRDAMPIVATATHLVPMSTHCKT